MAPFVISLPTLCEGHYALDIFDSSGFNTTTGNHFLFTMDVNSLYPVIQNDSGLQTLAYFLDKCEVKETSTSPAPRMIVQISRAGAHLKFLVVKKLISISPHGVFVYAMIYCGLSVDYETFTISLLNMLVVNTSH